MSNDDPVELTMILVRETDAAYLMAETEDHDGVWIPKSMITDLEETSRTKPNVILGKTRFRKADHDGAAIVQFSIPEWLAFKIELI